MDRAGWHPRDRALTPTTALAAVVALLVTLLGTSVSAASAATSTTTTTTTATTTATGPLNYGPAPWWQGDCDATHWAAVAKTLGWTGTGSHPLGASYLGIEVCGPRPAVDGSPNVLWGRAGWGESEWQCVELAQRFMAQVYGTKAFQANGADVVAHYDAATDGGGLVKIANGTVGVAPVPGDIVSFRTTKNPYGHVTVVVRTSIDATGTGTVTMLSQNDSVDGWRTLPITGWRIGALGSLVPYGWLHDPLGRGNPLGDGSFVRVNGTTTVYRLAGGAPVPVSSWTVYGGVQKVVQIDQPQFDRLRLYPANGSYVKDMTTGEVFRMAGGAPLLVGSDAAQLPLWSTAAPVGLDHVAFVKHQHLRAVPMDHTQICRADDGSCYVVAGGAPLRVPAASMSTTPGWAASRSVTVSGAEFSAWRSLRTRPVNGTFVCDASNARCYRVAGGSPLWMSSSDGTVPGFDPTKVVRAPHYEFAYYQHLAPHPADGTVLCPVGDRSCYVVAGHAPLAIAPRTSPAVSTSAAVVVPRTEFLHPQHLIARPVDGTVLRTAQDAATYVVRGGVATLVPPNATAATTTDPVVVDRAAIDNAGLPGAWSHLVSLPATVHLTTPRVTVTQAASALITWDVPVSSSAVTTYDVRTRRSFASGAAGAWGTPTTGLTATSTTLALRSGYGTCVQVRAHNRAGQVGPWTSAWCASRPLDDKAGTRVSTGWTTVTSTALYGGSALRTTHHKASWTFAGATVKRIGLVATTVPNGGWVWVYVGSTLVGKLGLSSPTTVNRQYLELPLLPTTMTGDVTVVVASPDGRPVQLDGVLLSRM